jgi:ferrous iron transport protein B
MKKIILAGNPNIGKSAVFSRLTGANVIASNYPGTTVEYTKGVLYLDNGEKAEIIDVPGIYSLKPASKADQVAYDMLKQADIIVNVIDSTNLERNLNLTVQLLKNLNIPTILALNMDDIARHNGIDIDEKALTGMLGIPVVKTTALSGVGIKQLKDNLLKGKRGNLQYNEEEKWKVIGNIIENVQKTAHRHPTFLELLSKATVHSIIGPVIAFLILFVAFWLIRTIGEGLINYLFDPVFDQLWKPLMVHFSGVLQHTEFIHNMLIGKLIEGEINFQQSFGLLTTGLYIPIAAVLPYIFSFYLILTIIEDVGYLPRLGVLADNLMHKFGLHGLSVIPMFLAFGCNVPGAMATRVLESKRERFIAATMMSISIPCMAQIAMISGLLGPYGAKGFFPLFFILFLLWITAGIVLKKTIKGESPEIVVDIPLYHVPYWKSVVKKVWMRLKSFIAEAIPFVLLGVFVVNLLYISGVISFLGKAFGPIITGLFGLPGEAVSALIVGFLRKDVAIGMLAPLGLSLRQLIVASAVLTIYFPCVATFIVLLKELGIRYMLKAAGIMLLAALIVGTAANWIMILLGM